MAMALCICATSRR